MTPEPRLRKRLLGLLALFGALYLLLATPLWNYVYGRFLEATQLATVNDDPTQNLWCAFGNQVLYTFQPLVSDDEMIAHWKANRQQLEALAYKVREQYGYMPGAEADLLTQAKIEKVSVAQYLPVSAKSSLHASIIDTCTRNFREMRGDIRSIWECLEAGAAPTVNLLPDFGKTAASFFCSTPHEVQKRYEFFLNDVPRQHNGRIYPVETKRHWMLDNPTWVPRETPGVPLVERIDRLAPKECVLRQLDERWYLSLCQANPYLYFR